MSSIMEFFDENVKTDGVTEAVYASLFKGNNLVLNEDIDDDSIGVIINQIQVLAADNKDPITIRVNTDGGCVYNFLRLYDVCRAVKNRIVIIAEGKAFSAGAFIVACCGDFSSCYKNTSFMLHEVSSWNYGKTSEVDIAHKEQLRVQNIIFGLLKKHTKMKQNDIDRFEFKDFWFNAATAKRLGIINKVI